MHFCHRQAAPCMSGGAWVGARCWLGGRGRGLFILVCDVIIGGLLHEMAGKTDLNESKSC